MRAKRGLRSAGYSALLVLLGILLWNNLSGLFSNASHLTGPLTGYFISSSNQLCGSFSYEDHLCPADNEEDEDEDEDDDENGFESSVSRSFHEFNLITSFAFHQDRLFCDPLTELVSPPPKV